MRVSPTFRSTRWAPASAAILLAAALATPAEAQRRQRYDATIVRTTYGIPHITARDHQGLGYGVGYTAGEDNVCVIAEQLVTVRGERAQHLGAGPVAPGGGDGPSNIESDIYHRVTGDPALLQRNLGKLSADARALVQGFADGYNRYLRDAAARLPAPCGGQSWVRPMSLPDALLLMQGSLVAPIFLRPIAAAAPPGTPAAGAPGASGAARAPLGLPHIDAPETALGSNGWAFGSQATANGRGLLVGNPHYPWEGPNRFRQMHLTIPGRLDVMGAGLIVTPLVGIGFNKDIAWTHTVTTARHNTVFELKLDPKDPTAYLVDGRSEPMQRRTVTLQVKGAAPVTRIVYSTRYGPVASMEQAGLGWTAERAFAIRDANFDNVRGVDTWLAIGRARNVREIRSIIGRSLGIGFTNTIAADRGGEALYADVTPVPNVGAAKLEACTTDIGRLAATQRIYILDGARASCNWDVDASTPEPGLMPERLLPTLFRRDFVQNSNDSYWLSNPAAPLPAASPLVGPVDARPSFRTQSGILEIQRALASGKMTQERARDLILANRSMAAERMVDGILAICTPDPALAAPCAALRNWDREAELASRGAVLFFSFLRNFSGSPDLWRVAFDPADPVNTPRDLNPAAAEPVRKALAAAAKEMTDAGVPLDASLGAVQATPRAGGPIPIHGGPPAAGILNMMQARLTPTGLVPVHGSSYVQIVSFDARGPVADALLSYSQSTDPASPHSQDQTRAFSEKRWHRLPFTAAEISRAALAPARRLSE
jgi:acyl-homoserine-lactone acylase